MHIILGALGAIITILILLKRLDDAGIDLGWLNPFAWKRRRAWQKKLQAEPLFSVTDPMEAVATLCFCAARATGELSREQKASLLALYRDEFEITEDKATELLGAVSFMAADYQRVIGQPKRFLEPSLERFNSEQAASTLNMLCKAVSFEGSASSQQKDFVERVEKIFTPSPNNGKW